MKYNAEYFQFRAIDILIKQLNKLNLFSYKWEKSKQLQKQFSRKDLILSIDSAIGQIESLVNEHKPDKFKKDNSQMWDEYLESKDQALAFISKILKKK